MAREMAIRIGREVRLARMNHGMSMRAVARIAGVSQDTPRRVEAGEAGVQLRTTCSVASAVGLRVWGRAFPASAPTLRDTGQLWAADRLRDAAHPSFSVGVEVALGNLRSADLVLFGADEIIHVEIERALVDFQAQLRTCAEKRDLLAAEHQRAVRLVIVVEDARRNRDAVRRHAAIIRAALPAGSREVLRALRHGTALGRDGLMWIRHRRPVASDPSDTRRMKRQ